MVLASVPGVKSPYPYLADAPEASSAAPFSTVALVEQIARQRGLAVGLVYDPDAEPSQCWLATIGLDAMGAGAYPSAALGAALLALDK